MSRLLIRLGAWAAATLLAMTVSWFGVRTALFADARADAPQAIPIAPAAPSPGAASGRPQPPSGSPTPSPTPLGATTAPDLATPAPRPPPAAVAPAVASPSSTATVQAYQLTGGRVVLEMTQTSARLVSATPEPGWQVQAWQATGWLRVDFSREGAASSCFVTWNGHPPSVQTT